MARFSSDDDGARARERLDGRVAFTAAAFALAYAFVALLDRVGAPLTFVEAVSPYFTIAALAALGALLHSMRVTIYYAAGRAIPFEYVGFASATLVAGVILPFATQFAARSWLLGVAAGVFIGVAVIGVYIGPILRKAGAFSFFGLLAARFPGLAPRLGVIATACVSAALIAVAGEQLAVDVLAGLVGGRGFAAAVIGLAVLLIAGPGGLFGTIWTACAAGAVALVGFGWPVAVLMKRGVSRVGGEEVAARLADWGAVAGSGGFFGELVVALAVALGMVTLAPLLAPAIATRDPLDAGRAGLAAIGWTLAFACLIAIGLSGAATSLARQSVGQVPERLPDAVYAVSAHGLVTICGEAASSPTSAHRACARRATTAGRHCAPRILGASGALLLTSLPSLEQMGAAVSGLLASAQIALALALAAAGLQAFGTALGHEAIYRLRGESDLTSRRLVTTRLALWGVATLGAASSAFGLYDPRALIGLALALSAATATPVLALALWPRADDRAALLALLAGLLGLAAAAIVSAALHAADGLAISALAGAMSGLAAGVVSARSRPAGSIHARAFVARLLRGDGEVMGPEKGA